jgi:hypothetical protein
LKVLTPMIFKKNVGTLAVSSTESARGLETLPRKVGPPQAAAEAQSP